jgi:tripartite-type tricarboxylate transporter receptor subunit TctC
MNRSQFIRTAAVAAIMGFGVVTGAKAIAQPKPTTKLIVGFVAGGPLDMVARVFAEHARQTLGTTMVVENRPGASGTIAIDALLRSPNDGLTVLIAPASLLELTPLVNATATYDPVRDFSAIGSLAEYGFAFGTGPATGVKDIAAFKEWAKANPASSNFGTPGQGTPQQFLGAQLEKALDIDMTHIPYKGGAASLNDVMGGQISMLVSTEQLLVPYEGQGKLNTLFITSKERNPLMPNVPTAKEAGLPTMETVDWFGAFVKADTPADKVAEWKAQVQKVTASADYIEAIKKLGYSVPNTQPADFSTLIDAERTAWAARVEQSGFKSTD